MALVFSIFDLLSTDGLIIPILDKLFVGCTLKLNVDRLFGKFGTIISPDRLLF